MKNVALRFALTALLLTSPFASTAFATTISQPVIVTNTSSQAMPIYGNVKDSDAPGRKMFQSAWLNIEVGANQVASQAVVTVPTNRRLIIEQISGGCENILNGQGYAYLHAANATADYRQFLNRDFLPSAENFFAPTSEPVRFYADAGQDLTIDVWNGGTNPGACDFTVTGYFITAP